MLVSTVRIHASERGPALLTAISVMTGTQKASSRYCERNEQGHGLGQVLSDSVCAQQRKHGKFTLQSCCA